MPYLTDADKNTELEQLTFAPGTCTDCKKPDMVYHDRETGEYLCIECLTEAVDAEADKVNAQEWDWQRIENARLAREAAQTTRYAPTADYPF